MSKFTKKAIVDTFIQMLEEQSLDKIHITDIIQKTGINRNTFYYYYQDLYSLLNDIFTQELEQIKEEAKSDRTFYEAYVRGAKMLLTQRQAVIHIYQSKDRDLVDRYLHDVVFDFVERFVTEKAAPHHLSQNQILYITSFYSYAIIGSTMKWIQDGLPSYRADILKMNACSFEATIDDMIQAIKEAGDSNYVVNLHFN